MSKYLQHAGQQPFYFQIVPRNIISKDSDKDKQQEYFKFYVYKTTQQVDFTKKDILATFIDRKISVKDVKLNFFLQNYIAGKNSNSKFFFQLQKKSMVSNQKCLSSYTIDPNVYIEEFKKNGKNHYQQIWQLSNGYAVEIELFFQESKYKLEKLLKQNVNSPATTFNQPLISNFLEKQKELLKKEQQDYDNQEKYSQKRRQLINKFSGLIVGHGGYRIFDEKQKQNKKPTTFLIPPKNQNLSNPLRNSQLVRNQLGKSLSKIQQMKIKKQSQKKPQASVNFDQPPLIKRTESFLVGGQPEEDMRNLKKMIVIVVLLILAGSAYFMLKIHFKDHSNSSNIETKDNIGLNNEIDKKVNKVKNKKNKKSWVQNQQI